MSRELCFVQTLFLWTCQAKVKLTYHMCIGLYFTSQLEYGKELLIVLQAQEIVLISLEPWVEGRRTSNSQRRLVM